MECFKLFYFVGVVEMFFVDPVPIISARFLKSNSLVMCGYVRNAFIDLMDIYKTELK